MSDSTRLERDSALLALRSIYRKGVTDESEDVRLWTVSWGEHYRDELEHADRVHAAYDVRTRTTPSQAVDASDYLGGRGTSWAASS